MGTTEIWYRGEGVGVAPSKVGGALHDLGDGLYLTDSPDVAQVYASRRAATASAQRVFLIEVERATLGRVLDLTADARWAAFMNAPIVKGQNGRLFYLKIKQELYGQFFKEFLAKYKIDIRKYDAVVGPEFNLGGKQLCILHKNNLPTSLARRVRALFRPVNTAVAIQGRGASASVKLSGSVRPKLAFVKSAGRFMAATAIMILLSYFMNKWIQKMHNEMIEKKLAGLDPDIQKSLDVQRRTIIDFLAHGQKAFAIVNVEISYYMSLDPDPQGGGWDQSSPGVSLIWVDVRDHKVEGAGKEVVDISIGQRHHRTPYTLASELTLPAADIERYKALLEQLDWYDCARRSPHIIESDKAFLASQRQALSDEIDSLYGTQIKNDIPYEQLFPAAQ